MKWDEADWEAKRLKASPDAAAPATVSPSLTVDILLELPDKPSIAVLPFQNIRGYPEQEYFVDRLVEDIIPALSSFKSQFVVE